MVGSRSQAYFVGKRALIEWINDYLDLNIKKVEECATGTIYCQLLDAIFPGKVNMKKVDFGGKQKWDYTRNWKIVQEVFVKENVPKKIPMNKLVEGRFQDNLEFLQWFHHYFTEVAPDPPEYNAQERRALAKGTGSAKKKDRRKSILDKTRRKLSHASPVGKRTPSSVKRSQTNLRKINKRHINPTKKEIAELKKALLLSQEETSKVRNAGLELERERDYYFAILCKVEKRFEAEPASDLKTEVLNILYDKKAPTPRNSLVNKKKSLEAVNPPLNTSSTPRNSLPPKLDNETPPKEMIENPPSQPEPEVSVGVPQVSNSQPTQNHSTVKEELMQMDLGPTYDADSSGLLDLSLEGKANLVDDLNVSMENEL